MLAEFNIPANIIFGSDCIDLIGNRISDFKLNKLFICTDKGIIEEGILKPIIDNLKKHEIDYVVFDSVIPNPTIDIVKEGSCKYENENCDGIIAVGGGSPLDAAKAIGINLSNPGPITNYEEGIGEIKHDLPTIIAVPTTYGTGSEVSGATVITNTEKKYKMVIVGDKIIPDISFVDPKLFVKLPFKIARSTGMDALIHAIESYIAKGCNPFSDALAYHAIKLISENLLPAATSNYNLEATANMAIASTMAAMSFNTTGLGLVHALAHAIGGFFNTAHGVTNSILLPYVLEFNKPTCINKFAELNKVFDIKHAQRGNKIEQADNFIKSIDQLSSQLDIPSSFKDINLNLDDKEDEIVRLAMNDGNIESNPRECDYENLINIVKKSFE